VLDGARGTGWTAGEGLRRKCGLQKQKTGPTYIKDNHRRNEVVSGNGGVNWAEGQTSLRRNARERNRETKKKGVSTKTDGELDRIEF